MTRRSYYRNTFNVIADVLYDSFKCEKDNLKESTHVVSDLDMDSLSQMELVMRLEEKFRCKPIDDNIIDKWRRTDQTLSGLVKIFEPHNCYSDHELPAYTVQNIP